MICTHIYDILYIKSTIVYMFMFSCSSFKLLHYLSKSKTVNKKKFQNPPFNFLKKSFTFLISFLTKYLGF